jgi:tRNA A37 threonylcarbamoyladenosine dehydratase
MDIFQRTGLLFGDGFLEAAANKRVIVFGLGGVGSWCAEMLIRSGIGTLAIVDADVVDVTNINRQLPATTTTISRPKVEVMYERLQSINPSAHIIPLQRLYSAETCEEFELATYDYIIDAIDSLDHKVHLIQQACLTPARLFVSMGAALKTDPLKIRIAEFNKVTICPLAAAVRKRIRKKGGVAKKFQCVYSEEHFVSRGTTDQETVGDTPAGKNKSNPYSEQKRINGTSSYMPAMFGMTLASLVIRAILADEESNQNE